MLDYRTSVIGHATEILLGPEFESLEPLIDRDTATYIVEVPVPTTCVWCGGLIVAARFPTRGWINIEVFADKDSALRADLLHEHTCTESQRFAVFSDAPTESEWDGVAQ